MRLFKRKQREDKRVILRHPGVSGLRTEIFTHDDHVDVIQQRGEEETHDARKDTVEQLTEFFVSKGYYVVNSFGIEESCLSAEIQSELK